MKYLIRNLIPHTALLCLMLGLVILMPAKAADLNFGKQGEAVHLVIGYQPYFTESWSSVVMRDKKYYEKYLPKGSSVEFQIALQGSTIVEGMVAGKIHAGYLGDMPAIVSTTKQDVADIRLVGVVGMASGMCNVLLVSKAAPSFTNASEAIAWLNGKRLAAPRGSCADRFAQLLLTKGNVKVADYKNLNIEAITRFLKEGKIDAAVVWEPTVSRLVQDGAVRRAVIGADIGEKDGAFLAMRADLIRQRPDVVKAWLLAELDAQLFISDKNNAMDVMRMVRGQTGGIPDKALWHALYGRYPGAYQAEASRLEFPFVFTSNAMTLLNKSTAFLHQIKVINFGELRPEAVMPEFAEEVLKSRKLTTPAGKVMALPDSAYSGN